MIIKPFTGNSAVATIDLQMRNAGEDELPRLRQRRANALKGVGGEREVARAVDRHFGTSRKLAVFHDVLLEARGVTFQIDHLLVSRILCCAWLIETKSLNGRISINTDGEWIQTLEGSNRVIPSPLDQAKGACLPLQRWLEDAGHERINQVVPVVLVPHTTSIDRSTVLEQHSVVKADMFADWWDDWLNDQTFFWWIHKGVRYMRRGMTEVELRSMGGDVLKADALTRERFASDKAARHDGGIAEGWEIQNGIFAKRNVYGIAIRHKPDQRLSAVVTSAATGLGHWNDRFENWIIPENDLAQFTSRLGEEMSR